jgi:hypothetical protein
MKVDSGLDLLIDAANIMTPEQATERLDKLRDETRHYHRHRARLYWFMFDSTNFHILKTFAADVVTDEFIDKIKKNIMKEITILNDILLKNEAEIEALKAFLKNE